MREKRFALPEIGVGHPSHRIRLMGVRFAKRIPSFSLSIHTLNALLAFSDWLLQEIHRVEVRGEQITHASLIHKVECLEVERLQVDGYDG